VDRIAHRLGIKKAGHAGTLDPGATGVLLVCVGRATRISTYLMDLPKCYRAVMRLGEVTDTQDADGTVVERFPVPALSREDVQEAAGAFLGTIEQTPPMYSALKHRGVPLYRLARQGKTVLRRPREITIFEIAVVAVDLPSVVLDVTCSKGTYIRTLCEDLGRAMGTGAHMTNLVRTAVGPFAVSDGVAPDDVTPDRIIPAGEALGFFPKLAVPAGQGADRLLHGNSLRIGRDIEDPGTADRSRFRLIHPERGFMGVGRKDGGCVRVEALLTGA